MKSMLLLLAVLAVVVAVILAKRGSAATGRAYTMTTPEQQAQDAASGAGMTADDWASWSAAQDARTTADPTAKGWFDDNDGTGLNYETLAAHQAARAANLSAAASAKASRDAATVQRISALNALWLKTPMDADTRAAWAIQGPYPMPLDYNPSDQLLTDYSATVQNAIADLQPDPNSLGFLVPLLNVGGSALGLPALGTVTNKLAYA
jgi:hypothetical protein